MDPREEAFIRENKRALLKTLRYGTTFAAYFEEKSVLEQEDFQRVKVSLRNEGERGAVSTLLDILIMQVGGFGHLLRAARETTQTGAVEILNKFNQGGAPNEQNQAARQGPGPSGRANNPPDEVDDVNDPEYKEVLDFIHDTKKLDVEIDRPDADAVNKINKLSGSEDSVVLAAGQRGLALLLNIIEFQAWDRRNGSDKDVEYLTELLMQLDYEIFPKRKAARESSKKTIQDMREFIREFKDRCNRTKPKSIIVFVGTHGFHPLQLATSDTESVPPPPKVKLDLFEDIVDEFSHKKCPGLIGKPKIFLIQACQSFLPRTESDAMKNRYIDDALIYTAGMPGEPVNRDIYKGSWFVYGFTYMMMKHAKNESFQEIMERVKKMLGMIKSEKGNEQVSMPFSYMKNKLYFSIDP